MYFFNGKIQLKALKLVTIPRGLSPLRPLTFCVFQFPPWMAYALAEEGVTRWDKGNNPRIVEYIKTTTLGKDYWKQSTAWCASFVNWSFKQSGTIVVMVDEAIVI